MAEQLHPFIGKGLDDPMLGSQRCFRVILAAMSEPGTIHRLSEAIEAPPGVGPAAMLVLLTLADQETPVWLASPYVDVAAPFMRFHCGAPLVEAPFAAAYALLDGAAAEPAIASFEAGDDRYPDRSATLVVQCAALHGGPSVRLTGPGIDTARMIAPAGLRNIFWDEIAANNARYPLGVDLILAAGDAILAVPRSSVIELMMEAS